MSFDIVKREYRPISGGQLGDGLVQRYPVNYRHRIGIQGAFNYLDWRFTILSCLFHSHSALAEVHEHLIDCHAVQPGGKGRFTSKTPNFSKELDKNLLSKIFSLRHISGHPQAQGVDSTIMTLVELLEGAHIALGSLLCQLEVSRLRCLGVRCGHVFVCLGKLGRNLTSSPLVRHDHLTDPLFQGSSTFPLKHTAGLQCKVRYPQRGCDAALEARRCLTRS